MRCWALTVNPALTRGTAKRSQRANRAERAGEQLPIRKDEGDRYFRRPKRISMSPCRGQKGKCGRACACLIPCDIEPRLVFRAGGATRTGTTGSCARSHVLPCSITPSPHDKRLWPARLTVVEKEREATSKRGIDLGRSVVRMSSLCPRNSLDFSVF